MNASSALRSQHPTFVAWLEQQLPLAFGDDSVIEPFLELTGVERGRAFAYIEGGTFAPVLFHDDLGLAWGMFDREILLRVNVSDRLVAAVSDDVHDHRRTRFATAKILHELVHLGQEETGNVSSPDYS